MIKQVPIERLRAGMFLHRLEGSWMEHPFWRKAFLLSEGDVALLRETGLPHAWIDTDRGLDVEAAATAPGHLPEPDVDYVDMPALPDPTMPMALATPDVQEMALEDANRLCTNAAQALAKVFTDVRLGRALDSKLCASIVREVVEQVMGDPGALILVARLKNHDDYSHMHSVAVCALMVALGRQLGFSRDSMSAVGLAGLLHDVGKLLVPVELLNKRGPLTPVEYQLVKTHVHRGHALLREGGTTDATVLDVCLHHHERMDGSGYPHGVRGTELSLPARMAAVCDVYDALTSERPHRPRIEPGMALKQMASQGGKFDPTVLQAFVRTVGIYPVGSLVRLRSQELAVVVAQDRDDLLKPRVQVFYSLTGRRAVGPSHLTLSHSSNGVANLETPETLGLDIMRVVATIAPQVRAA